MIWREDPARVRPMLATLADPPLKGAGLVFEPKYDGIRALVHVAPGRPAPGVRIWSRLGNDKTAQFPAVARAFEPLGRALDAPLLVDGEIVALDERGRPAGFQRLQGRMHVTDAREVERLDAAQPAAFIAFDLLRDGEEDVRGLSLTERRARLETRLRPYLSGTLRLSEQVAADGRALHERAKAEGWEGLIVKEAAAPYQSGRRSPSWRKLKLVNQEEFVIGGWTEPRSTRAFFGALLLGLPDGADAPLTYVGHTGTGFDHKELERVWRLLKARETDRSPFAGRIKTNEPAHWVRPELVAQIRFTEWTADRKLRHPVYLGLRDDVRPARHGTGAAGPPPPAAPPAEAGRRAESRAERRPQGPRGAGRADGKTGAVPGTRRQTTSVPNEGRRGTPPATRTSAARRRATAPVGARGPAARRPTGGGRARRPRKDPAQAGHALDPALQQVVAQLEALEEARRDGTIGLPDGARLGVTNLAKVFWPDSGLTKGGLLRYYVRVAPLILPAVTDRPLVMKRFPNGITQPAFYQQRSRLEKPPAGVRIETLPPGLDPISEPDARRFIGGNLITLLYMTQIAAISQDPWFSRVQSPLDADYVAIDLDPGDRTPFSRVLDVARWVRDELHSLRVPAVPKTSGSRGLHIYIPLPPETSYESGMLFCQIVATLIASRHPRAATVERTVRARPAGTVYVDYLQNILGKTLATAYSARASEFAGVSTPLAWEELDEPLDPRDFTIVTAPARFAERGDLWARLRTERPARLDAVLRKYVK